ncbi:Protein CBG02178 [Caenorhabditis briggsae]|uniref:Protein CBG02178 n=1 Tax=Caenorhabditis briggsae TaxID=6238 RepID=A8WS45_CAEBR|nr:Protein CBG02178 [Caenorhabditis briggsae]CAP23303.2 Protein CBG02178 [Caenorhabditis briggsae]
MNSDCDYNIKSSSRYFQSESCTKLNYVYTSRQCDEYFEYLEELRRIIFGRNNTMSSAETLPTHPSSVHYHTQNGRTLVYEIGDSAHYGITLSQLPSKTEKLVTETFCAEEHVLAQPETSKIIPPIFPPKLFHQLPSNIEERMKNCLHSSSEVINSYLSGSIEQLEKFTTPCDDTAFVQNSSFKMPERQYHNSYNFSDDDFEDSESLNFGVDESFAVSEEFAKVLEETDSVFEELGGDDEFEDRWSISDDKVKRIVGIVKRHVPPSAVMVNHPPLVEYAPNPDHKSYKWLENDSFNFQLPSILNHRSEPLEHQSHSSIQGSSSNSTRKTSRSSTPSQSLSSQDFPISPNSSRKTSGGSTPLAGSVLVNMIEDYVKMVMDVSKALGNPSEAPEVVSEGVSVVLPVSNVIEKQRKTETMESLETEIESEKDEKLEAKNEDQTVMFPPIAPRKSSVEKWESATLKKERPQSFEESAHSEEQKHLEFSVVSSSDVFHTEPFTLEDIIRLRRSLSESSTLTNHSEYADALDHFDQPCSQLDPKKSPLNSIFHDDFLKTQSEDNTDVDAVNSNNFLHLSFSRIGSTSDNGISEKDRSSNNPDVENRKKEESQFFRVNKQQPGCPDVPPDAQINDVIEIKDCNDPQEDFQLNQLFKNSNTDQDTSESTDSNLVANKSFSSTVTHEIEEIDTIHEEPPISFDEFSDDVTGEHLDILKTNNEIKNLVENLLAHVKEETNNNNPESVFGENFIEADSNFHIMEVIENLLTTVSQMDQRPVENFPNDVDVEEADDLEEDEKLDEATELDFGLEYDPQASTDLDEDQRSVQDEEEIFENLLDGIASQVEKENTETTNDTDDSIAIQKVSEPGISIIPDEELFQEPTSQFDPNNYPETLMENIPESHHNFNSPANENFHGNGEEIKDVIISGSLPAETNKINIQTSSTEYACSETEEGISNEQESRISDMETENNPYFNASSTETDTMNCQKVLDDVPDCVPQTSNTISQVETNKLANELAGQLADRIAGELADQLANEIADELADQLADQVADQVADQLADQLADELADQLADELADEDAARLDNEEISEFETELEIYEGSPEQKNEADVLNVLQSVLNEVLYDLNGSENACFSSDILDEAQSTSSSPNFLETELSTEAWEALHSVLDNLDVIIHNAEIRQIDEAVDFVQEPFEIIEVNVKNVEESESGLEDSVELDIKLEYDDQDSTDLNDDLVQQGEIQETLNDIVCIVDVVESFLLEMSNSTDSEKKETEEVVETGQDTVTGNVDEPKKETEMMDVTHVGFKYKTFSNEELVDLHENKHHAYEEKLQEDKYDDLTCTEHEEVTCVEEEVAETVEILLNSVLEEEYEVTAADMDGEDRSKDVEIAEDGYKRNAAEHEHQDVDFQILSDSKTMCAMELVRGPVEDFEVENVEQANNLSSLKKANGLEDVAVLNFGLENDGQASTDPNDDSVQKKEVQMTLNDILCITDVVESLLFEISNSMDREQTETGNETETRRVKVSHFGGSLQKLQNEDPVDLNENEYHTVKKELQEQNHGVLVCGENDEIAYEKEVVLNCVSSATEVVETMENLLDGVTAADMDGEGTFSEQIERMEVSEDGLQENDEEREPQGVWLPILRANEKKFVEGDSHETLFNDVNEPVDWQDCEMEHHDFEQELQEQSHAVLVCAENEEVADAEKQVVLSCISLAVEIIETMEVNILEEEEVVSAANTDGEETNDGHKVNGEKCHHQEPPILEVNQKNAEGHPHETMSNQVDLRDFENEHHDSEQKLQEPNHGVLVFAENEEVAYAEEKIVLSCVSSAVKVVGTMEVLLNGIVEEEEEVVSAANTDKAEIKDGYKANGGNCEHQEPPILEVNQEYASHKKISNQVDLHDFRNDHHDFVQELQEPNRDVLVSNENEGVACEEEEVVEKVEILLNGVVEEEDRVAAEDMYDEGSLRKQSHMSEDVEERSEVPEKVNDQQPPTVLTDSIEELSTSQIKSETNSTAPNSTNSATEVFLNFEDLCVSYLENLIGDQLLSAMASASTMLTSQLELQMEVEDIYSISPAVPPPLSDSYSTSPSVLKSSPKSLESILEDEEMYSTPPGDSTDPMDAIVKDGTSQGGSSRLEEDIMCAQPRTQNHLFDSSQTKEISDKIVDDNQTFEIVDPDTQLLFEPSTIMNNQSASISHLVSDIPTVSRSLVPERSRGDDDSDKHLNLPNSCQQLQIEKPRPTPWGSSLVPESSDCSLCTDIYDPVPTNVNFSTDTSSSLNPSEHPPTSSVLEEVSHFLATACVAALVFVSPTESSDSTFNSDIIEDASKYINNNNSKPTS